jgi:hypothetical protein
MTQQGMAPIVPMQFPRVLTKSYQFELTMAMRVVHGRLTHASIPTMITLIALADKCLRIAWLEILSPRRLHVHDGIVRRAWRVRWTKATAGSSWLKTIVEC